VDTSKPANGAEPEQEYLYPGDGHSGNHFFAGEPGGVCTDLTWAEDMATQGCDQSADSAAGMARGGTSRPASPDAILARSDKSQGFGDSLPNQECLIQIYSSFTRDRAQSMPQPPIRRQRVSARSGSVLKFDRTPLQRNTLVAARK
jgi:hypothetical protein